MEAIAAGLLAARAEALAFYSPYYCLARSLPRLRHQAFGEQKARDFGLKDGEEILPAGSVATPVRWLLERLAWDSTYFETPTYRLFTGLFTAAASPEILKTAARELRQIVAQRGPFYAFSIVPAEDIRLFQALTGAGWQLIETRLTYYRDNLAAFQHPRYLVRPAQLIEKEHIGQIAAHNPNAYDRCHADPWFGVARANDYLAHYAAEAVAGTMADTVLVPAEPAVPLDSFLAISDLVPHSQVVGARLSRVMLTAVGPLNRGWHLKLVAETLHRAREQGHEAVLMTTQATNMAVCRTAEKLGFKLGGVAHVLRCAT